MFKGNFKVKFKDFSFNSGEFEISKNKITVIYGDSGSGKSTFLDCIAGLNNSYDGEINYIENLKVGYVFQENSLFPHMNVKKNLEYATKRCDEQKYSFDEIVETLNLRNLLDKKVSDLSGGEGQRVSIARSILSSPDILIMDEPLSALHSRAKSEILSLIIQINKNLNIPILVVTHSLREVFILCDEVIHVKEGRNLKLLTRKEALLELDDKGPINSIEIDYLKNFELSSSAKEYDSFIISSSNLFITAYTSNEKRTHNSIECTLKEIINFNSHFSILKLEYDKDCYLYSKVSNKGLVTQSFSIGERLLALFGPESHMI